MHNYYQETRMEALTWKTKTQTVGKHLKMDIREIERLPNSLLRIETIGLLF
jgi:hypothetical protein